MEISDYLQKYNLVDVLNQFDEIFSNFFYSDNPPFPRLNRYEKPKEGIRRYEEFVYQVRDCDSKTRETYMAKRCYYIIDYFWQSFKPVDIALFYASLGYRVLATNGITPPDDRARERNASRDTPFNEIELRYHWSKQPVVAPGLYNGANSATTDPDTIARWFSYGATSIGVVGDDKTMFLDVDNKCGWTGFQDIEDLEKDVNMREGGHSVFPAPDTFTPMNGVHITFQAPPHYNLFKNKKPWTPFCYHHGSPAYRKKRERQGKKTRLGIDIRVGGASYSISPGSIVHSPFALDEVVRYKGFILPPELYPALPKSIDELCEKKVERKIKANGYVHALNDSDAIEYFSKRQPQSAKVVTVCRDEVMRMPDSIEGQGGTNAMFAACCVVFKDYCLSYEQGKRILDEYNEKKAIPSWSESELLHKIRGAYDRCVDEPNKSGFKAINVIFGGGKKQQAPIIANHTIADNNNTVANNNVAKPETRITPNTEVEDDGDDVVGEEIQDVKKVTYKNIDPQPLLDAFECIPEVSQFAKEKSRLRKAPVGLFFTTFLNAFSSLLGNYYVVDTGKGWIVPGGGFNVLNLADSGVGKSSTGSIAVKPLVDIQAEIFNRETRLFHTHEEYEAFNNGSLQDDDSEPPLIMGTNQSFERIGLELADHKRFYWWWEEYMGLTKKVCPGGIDNGTVNALNTLCESGYVDYGTKQAKDLKGKKTGFAKDVVITLGGNSTIDDFVKAKQVQPLWFTGHFNRYGIFVFFNEETADQNKSLAERAEEELLAEQNTKVDYFEREYCRFMHRAFHKLYELKFVDTPPIVYKMGYEAQLELKKYELICRERGQDLPKTQAAFARRLVDKSVRIALIIHLTRTLTEVSYTKIDEHDTNITVGEVKQAIAIAEYIWTHFLLYLRVKANLGSSQLSPLADYILLQMTDKEERNKSKPYNGITVESIKNFTECRSKVGKGTNARMGKFYSKDKTLINLALNELVFARLAQVYYEDENGVQYWRLSKYVSDSAV